LIQKIDEESWGFAGLLTHEFRRSGDAK